jgi:streptogramin lyase
MRKIIAVLAVAAATTLAGSAFAASSTKSTKTKTTSSHTANGQIESYDGAAHQLTLKSGSGPLTFTVAPDAKVWAGKESVAVDQLSGRTGAKATVTYVMAGTEKTTHTIRLADAKTK